MRNIRTTKLNKGFTLGELLIVVAVIGILAGVIIFVGNGAQKKTQDTVCQENCRNLQSEIKVACLCGDYDTYEEACIALNTQNTFKCPHGGSLFWYQGRIACTYHDGFTLEPTSFTPTKYQSVAQNLAYNLNTLNQKMIADGSSISGWTADPGDYNSWNIGGLNDRYIRHIPPTDATMSIPEYVKTYGTIDITTPGFSNGEWNEGNLFFWFNYQGLIVAYSYSDDTLNKTTFYLLDGTSKEYSPKLGWSESKAAIASLLS